MEAAKDIWERVLGELQLQVSKANYTTWLANSYGASFSDGVFIVEVPNAFVAEWLTKRLSSLVKKTLTKIIGLDINIQFSINNRAQDESCPPTMAIQHDGGTSTKARTSRFSPQYTFDSFVVGSCNHLAYAATMEVASNPGLSYNPIFIYGATGQGKTHLLHAIGNKAVDNGLQVIYTTGERFTNDFVLSLRQKKFDSFQTKFNKTRILLFDDIQFINGKKQTQLSLLHIFNALFSNNCQFIITADRHPDEMDSFNSQLKSRLVWGPVFLIQDPDYDTRLSILRTKAAEMSLLISDELMQLIAGRIQNNSRRLEGALIYLTAQAKLTGMEINQQTVNNMLTNMTKNKRGTQILIQTVSNYFNLLPEDLTSKNRDRKTSQARQIAMFLMREDSNLSLADIGRQLGNRTHATIIHGYKRIAENIHSDTRLKNQLLEIRDQLRKNTASS